MSTEKQLDLHRQGRLQGDAGPLHTNPETKGVTVAWLALAFDIPEASVRHKLRNCPVKAHRIRGQKMTVRMYDIKDAARFLVAPAYSTKEYMRRLKKGDLPPHLQQAVWDALLKRQKWEENAGDLWRTDAIREVLRGTFQTLKFTMQLWVDTLEENTIVTDEQREMLSEMVDGLQNDLYGSLVNQMADKETGPQLDDLKEMFGETETVKSIMRDDMDEDEENQIEDLI